MTEKIVTDVLVVGEGAAAPRSARINTIRTLSIDAVQQAKSGHPGTPMALAPLVHTISPASGAAQGAYVLADTRGGNPELILIASGSEVSLVVEAYERLLKEGIRARAVSMPSWDIFEHQTQEYRGSVRPPNVKVRVAVEQASTFGWERYVGEKGRVIGMHTFGASAPLKELQKKFGFEPDQVVAVAKELLAAK
jgi:transketolase